MIGYKLQPQREFRAAITHSVLTVLPRKGLCLEGRMEEVIIKDIVLLHWKGIQFLWEDREIIIVLGGRRVFLLQIVVFWTSFPSTLLSTILEYHCDKVKADIFCLESRIGTRVRYGDMQDQEQTCLYQLLGKEQCRDLGPNRNKEHWFVCSILWANIY